MHRLGRIGAVCAIALMLAMPIIVSLVFGTFPGFQLILTASAGLLAIFIPVTISEVISFTPVLGSSIYLTLITGNVMNLKLPVATNALKLLDIEHGSEDADVISAIAVSISSVITVVIIMLGVILMVPLKPVLTIPSVSIATSHILPALFGALATGIFSDNIGGGIRAKGRLKAAIVPLIIMVGLYLINAQIVSQFQGFLIIAMLPFTYFGSKLLYKKGQIKVILPSDPKPEPSKK